MKSEMVSSATIDPWTELCDIYIYDINFGMLQVRENGISLRKWSGGAAHLCTLEGI